MYAGIKEIDVTDPNGCPGNGQRGARRFHDRRPLLGRMWARVFKVLNLHSDAAPHEGAESEFKIRTDSPQTQGGSRRIREDARAKDDVRQFDCQALREESEVRQETLGR